MFSKREGKGRIAISHEHAKAICYSGYREGQSPIESIYPSYEEVHQDLQILSKQWRYLRMYDCGPHAERALEVIVKENLTLKVMLGCDISAEVSNPNCPWGADYSDEILKANTIKNEQEIVRLTSLANRYKEQVFAVSVGNEASVDWTDHMVPVEKLTAYVRKIKSETEHPVTFCENYVPWLNKLEPLAAELDFISIHTYPAWEYQTIETALEYTKQNYYSVASHYIDKPVVITEAGWTTASNGRGIDDWNASEALQAEYYTQLMEWTSQEKIFTFVFEAFDEPWKGSPDPLEPEKHWGLFKVDRTPKAVMQERY
ncbi:MAG: exo-beta-1,3-glucanase (GH17 family) [Lentisphaeria bacterium]|jgi:exo-beta-1,3-glucanase (GH17 family)